MKKARLLGKIYACLFSICVVSFYAPQSLAAIIQLTASLPDVTSTNFTTVDPSDCFNCQDIDTIEILFADNKRIDVAYGGQQDTLAVTLTFASATPFPILSGQGSMSLLDQGGNPFSPVSMNYGNGNDPLEYILGGSETIGNQTVSFYGVRFHDFGPISLGTVTADSLTFETTTSLMTVSSVPIPAAFWLFGSGLLGLIGIFRRKKAT